VRQWFGAIGPFFFGGGGRGRGPHRAIDLGGGQGAVEGSAPLTCEEWGMEGGVPFVSGVLVGGLFGGGVWI